MIQTLKNALNSKKLNSENSPRMKQEHSEHQTGIYFAIGAALLLHILLLLALLYLPIITEEALHRTVPTVTITIGSRASNTHQQSKTQSSNTKAANAYLAILEAASFKVQQNQKHDKKIQQKKTSTPQPNTKNQTEKPPTKSLTSQDQISRAQKANQGMMNIFKQKKITEKTEKTEKISTTANKELSNYEISLRSILSRAVLYDEFHRFTKAKDNNDINLEVTLILHPSGAIKNAVISHSSGIIEIDALAKQNAFKASPYPRPPTEDMQKGFRYAISITHQKVAQYK